MKLSDYVLKFIKEQGVNHAFLITGGAIMNIVDSFDESKNIKYICTTQEQGAAMAAEAYSRINGNFGVAMATSGPGATNLITGIGCAYFDSIPVIYLTGQVNTYESRQGRAVRRSALAGLARQTLAAFLSPTLAF